MADITTGVLVTSATAAQSLKHHCLLIDRTANNAKVYIGDSSTAHILQLQSSINAIGGTGIQIWIGSSDGANFNGQALDHVTSNMYDVIMFDKLLNTNEMSALRLGNSFCCSISSANTSYVCNSYSTCTFPDTYVVFHIITNTNVVEFVIDVLVKLVTMAHNAYSGIVMESCTTKPIPVLDTVSAKLQTLATAQQTGLATIAALQFVTGL